MFFNPIQGMPFRRLYSYLARSTLLPPPLLKPLTIPNPNLSPSLRFSRPNHTYSPPKAQMSAARRHPSSVPIPALEKADRPELLRALEATLNCTFTTYPIAPPPRPLIVVISGPSGVGKDAVIKRLQEMRGDVHFVVTATTREMRPGEVEGKDYHFVKKDEFLSMIERNELLEYALVYGDYKGIPKRQIREFMAKGCDIVLRVDVQGAATLKRILGDSAVFIFLVAENELELVNRLVERKTETKETLQVRIATAREEVKCIREFDYVVVNAEGQLENATRMVEAIIDSEKARVRQRTASI